jgi:RNA polymerase sigma-70 factor, ECF subfamily
MAERRPTDEELMLAYQAGDVEAFEALFIRYRTRLFRYFRHLVRDPEQAEDLLQILFLRIHRARATYQPRALFSTWAYTIAHNLVRDAHAKRVTEGSPLSFAVMKESGDLSIQAAREPLVSSTPEALLSHKETAANVQRALLTLSPDAREIITLSKLDGLSFAQIADILGCSVSAAKVRAFRALRALYAALAEKGPLC